MSYLIEMLVLSNQLKSSGGTHLIRSWEQSHSLVAGSGTGWCLYLPTDSGRYRLV